MGASLFFGGMGHDACPSCGAFVKDTFEYKIDGYPCGDVICKWCEEDHNEICEWHDVVCCDHPCESCIDKLAGMYEQ
jgi:hypothetical protein